MQRKNKLVNDHIYHIYNRGVRKNKIYLSEYDYRRWQNLLHWCQNYNYPYSQYLYRVKQLKKEGKSPERLLEEIDLLHKYDQSLVKILANVEMPNHFHLILKQKVDNGISKFMQKLQTAYSKYFNLLHGFKGSVVESRFRSVLVKTDEQLLQLFRYLHTNPLAAELVSKDRLLSYSWSSLPTYIKDFKSKHLEKDFFLNIFNNNTNKIWNFTVAEFKDDDIDLLQDMTHDDDYDWYKELKRKRKQQYQKVINKVRAY